MTEEGKGKTLATSSDTLLASQVNKHCNPSGLSTYLCLYLQLSPVVVLFVLVGSKHLLLNS